MAGRRRGRLERDRDAARAEEEEVCRVANLAARSSNLVWPLGTHEKKLFFPPNTLLPNVEGLG
jgi:hypothetical protein